MESLKNSSKEFIAYVAASYPIIWIDTHEYHRCICEYSRAIFESKVTHKCYSWDLISGLSGYNTELTTPKYVAVNSDDAADDPLTPINYLKKLCDYNLKNKNNEKHAVMFAQDFHLYIKSPEIWRTLLNLYSEFSSNSMIFVIVSPVVEIPLEIKRYITVIDFNLPTKEDISKRLNTIIDDIGCTVDEEHINEIISSGTGLTMNEFDNAVYLSLAKNKHKILPTSIHQQKRQLIRKNNALDVVKVNYGFERIVGLDNMKKFVPKMVGKPNSRGILIVGVPGSGKSAFSKALGKETGRLTIDLDIGNLQGGIVGETEQNTKDALNIIDAMEPAILFLDELEKSLAGVSGYSGDSGTSKRQGGQILRWLNDHTSDVYVVATSNNIDELPPEYLRSGRWDAIFYTNVPNDIERQGLIQLYSNLYNIDANQPIPNINGWTGAEIENLCKLAANLECSLVDAAMYVCPMIKVSKDKIETMVNKVKNIAVPASSMPLVNHSEVNINRVISEI